MSYLTLVDMNNLQTQPDMLSLEQNEHMKVPERLHQYTVRYGRFIRPLKWSGKKWLKSAP